MKNNFKAAEACFLIGSCFIGVGFLALIGIKPSQIDNIENKIPESIKNKLSDAMDKIDNWGESKMPDLSKIEETVYH